jgi:hypothetical protein
VHRRANLTAGIFTLSSDNQIPTKASVPFWRKRWLLWLLAGLAFVVIASAGLVVFLTAQALDTDRDLSDFGSPKEARVFTSAHLPAPLPDDAVVERLHYERFTDWFLEATLRLPSSTAADAYFEEAKRARTLNDEYCLVHEDPSGGVRYFLSDVSACGAITRTSPLTISIQCNTR